MKIIDGIKIKGAGAEIPDSSRDDLPEFFKEMGYKSGAEIGVYTGEFSEKFCKAGFKFYAIDPWLNYGDYLLGQNTADGNYEHAKKVLAPYKNCEIIRKTSMEALADIPDESLDFVYIDGNHWFKYVAEDICEWSKKVRKGGVISGHDYVYTGHSSCLSVCHVIYVVDAYVAAYGIKDWYLLGRKNALEGEKRDRCRSWMWFKQ